jgi:hypothetical protein
MKWLMVVSLVNVNVILTPDVKIPTPIHESVLVNGISIVAFARKSRPVVEVPPNVQDVADAESTT